MPLVNQKVFNKIWWCDYLY